MEKSERFQGEPTRPSVDKLMAEVNAVSGGSISHETICKMIGVERGAHRFYTVTRRWRDRLRDEHGILVVSEGGAFRFLTADESQDTVAPRMSRLCRATGRLHRDAKAIRHDELSTEERRTLHRYQLRETAAALDALQMSTRRLAEPSAKTSDRPVA